MSLLTHDYAAEVFVTGAKFVLSFVRIIYLSLKLKCPEPNTHTHTHKYIYIYIYIYISTHNIKIDKNSLKMWKT
jgi:hypothetical protein